MGGEYDGQESGKSHVPRLWNSKDCVDEDKREMEMILITVTCPEMLI